jgi:hypothetical protein
LRDEKSGQGTRRCLGEEKKKSQNTYALERGISKLAVIPIPPPLAVCLRPQGVATPRENRKNVVPSAAGRMLHTDVNATQRTTTVMGSEHPAQAQQIPGTMNRINKCEFDQIIKRRNYKRGLLKCVDAMARNKVLRCTQLATRTVCD